MKTQVSAFHRVAVSVGIACLGIALSPVMLMAQQAPAQQASAQQAPAQQAPVQPNAVPQNPATAVDAQPPEAKRLFWIIPNYRTAPAFKDFEPIGPGAKFKIATQDAFDRGTIGLAAIFAGESQLTNANRSFGQGGAGYGRYFGTAYADLVIGDYFTEGVFPALLHQDPRYFRKGTGSKKARLGYAMGQIFITHGDSGRTEVNYSEFLGNATAVAISQSYYADNRDAGDAVSKFGFQLGVDMASNVLKEFWPEISRPFNRKHH